MSQLDYSEIQKLEMILPRVAPNIPENWGFVATSGSMNNYPRPQGNLPMFTYGLKKEQQQKFQKLYNAVLQLPDNS